MNTENSIIGYKRGYLTGDFEFFHLKDKKNIQFEYHYHDFNKILIFISGNVNYLIEGKAYKLKPWDILLISNKEVHMPVIDPDETYERIIIWVNSDFMEKHNNTDCNLLTCFEMASRENFSLLRLNPPFFKSIKPVLLQLEESCRSDEFGSRILKNSLFLQLIVYLNRYFKDMEKSSIQSDIIFDENIGKILSYINDHLNEDLSIENLSSIFFMSKYYLMHWFKKQTGYSIHSYILQKRLIMANELIKSGMPAIEVCALSGFGDYSSFVRAFKKAFGLSPKNYFKSFPSRQTTGDTKKHF
jgi:AraC-like DNA-binding protein